MFGLIFWRTTSLHSHYLLGWLANCSTLCCSFFSLSYLNLLLQELSYGSVGCLSVLVFAKSKDIETKWKPETDKYEQMKKKGNKMNVKIKKKNDIAMLKVMRQKKRTTKKIQSKRKPKKTSFVFPSSVSVSLSLLLWKSLMVHFHIQCGLYSVRGPHMDLLNFIIYYLNIAK
jgi:hypothetical protein